MSQSSFIMNLDSPHHSPSLSNHYSDPLKLNLSQTFIVLVPWRQLKSLKSPKINSIPRALIEVARLKLCCLKQVS